MENLNSIDDVTILNALFAIAAIESDEYSELTWQDERVYRALDWELSKRMMAWGDNGYNTIRD